MKFFLAPMQGLTGYTVRNAFHHHFDYIDKYYTPFIPAAKRMNAKIKRDIDPVNNDGITLIPQAMSIVADEVIDLHRQLVPYGYDEINVNLGCPSGTVVSKKRGSGILANPDMQDSFLEDLYTKAEIPVSIKTRVGYNEDELWPRLIEIYSKYQLREFSVHPRVEMDFYKNTPRMDDFALAMQKINPDKTILCYNGDITDTNSFKALTDCFPDIDEIMIGRGLFANPALIAELKGISMDKAELRERLKNWHDEILSGYLSIFSGEKDAMFRMKEIWAYMHGLFSDSEKLWKKIKKCQTLNDYKSIVRMAFDSFYKLNTLLTSNSVKLWPYGDICHHKAFSLPQNIKHCVCNLIWLYSCSFIFIHCKISIPVQIGIGHIRL